MGASHKEAAREFMRRHPGTTFPAAKRSVARRNDPDTDSARPQTIPWFRWSLAENTAACYFCGEDALIRSSGDVSVDSRRIQVYCDNDQCDARSTEVVVVDDGTEDTATRADVRVLAKYGPVVDRPASSFIEEVGDWIPGATPVARTAASVCLYCGEMSCRPAPADAEADTGRIRLRCTNPACDVVDVEVLLLNDGTPWTQSRGDVEGLDKLIPRRGGTTAGGVTFYAPSELRVTDEEILARRVSGVMP